MADNRSFPRGLVACLLVAAVVLANAAFIGLGSVFNYPDVLQEPADEILTAFRADEGVIIGFFVCGLLVFAWLIWRRGDRVAADARIASTE